VTNDDLGATIPRLKSPWLKTFFRTQGLSFVVAVVSLLVTLAVNSWKPDDLVAYFRFADPKEVGTNQLHLNYIFSNAGKTPTFIEDVSLTEVFYQNKGNASATPSLDICKDQSIETPTLAALMPAAVRSIPLLHREGWYSKL
jgi:hypothetical protein